MEVTFTCNLTPKEKGTIRQIAWFYPGIATFEIPRILKISPKEDFLKVELMEALQGSH